jgi:hypothetical protein
MTTWREEPGQEVVTFCVYHAEIVASVASPAIAGCSSGIADTHVSLVCDDPEGTHRHPGTCWF